MNNARQKTIADIVAWLRRSRDGEKNYITLERDEIADCIEAAHKREIIEAVKPIEANYEYALEQLAAKDAEIKATREKSSHVGNAAKMREALEQIHELLSIGGNPDTAMCIRYEAAYQIAAEALSAPPRNCDRPECATSNAAQCVWNDEDGGKTAYYDWLLATFTTGEAK